MFILFDSEITFVDLKCIHDPIEAIGADTSVRI